MPSNEIEKEQIFADESNLKITIQAGENGWTILWADGVSSFREENFNEAYGEAVKCIGKLFLIGDK